MILSLFRVKHGTLFIQGKIHISLFFLGKIRHSRSGTMAFIVIMYSRVPFSVILQMSLWFTTSSV